MIPPKLDTLEEYLTLYLLLFGRARLFEGDTVEGEAEFLDTVAEHLGWEQRGRLSPRGRVTFAMRELVTGDPDDLENTGQ